MAEHAAGLTFIQLVKVIDVMFLEEKNVPVAKLNWGPGASDRIIGPWDGAG